MQSTSGISLQSVAMTVGWMVFALSVISFSCVAAADDLLLGQDRSATGKVRFVPSENEANIAPIFQLEQHTFEYELVVRKKTWFQLIPEQIVRFPSPQVTPFECNNTVHCEYFVPRGKKAAPGVIVLHILGGDFELSRTICRTLALNGIGALFLKMPYYGPRRPAGIDVRMISADLTQTQAGMQQAVLDVRRATAWLASRPEINPERLGITGISLGGIVAALAASAEPRLSKACLVLAGGDLAKMIRESDELGDIRKQWKAKSIDEKNAVAQLRTVDPLTYAKELKQRQLLMFNARKDKVIPPACSQALWEAAGKPEIEWWNAGHYSAAWYLPRGLARMLEFFRTDNESE
ncbi:MAG: alpha/beta hydrolase family protein [Planctomycetaceae bacterium]|nr:alpha/beta hydrolase family protein [Planctomycetaceae bacterium]